MRLVENDAALDVSHWAGHSGCVILAPHLVGLKKKDLGLPHFDEATERQRRDDMCWRDEGEIYNGGSPFKIVCRYEPGVIVTIIADNYYGYCKKEVKSQISFATNLYGACEEEHAGGAMAFATYALGQEFHASRTVSLKKTTFVEAMRLLEGLVDGAPEGHAIDRRYDDVYYVPEDAEFSVQEGFVRWQSNNEERSLVLRPGAAYFLPSGFRVRLEKQSRGAYWQLVGTRPRGRSATSRVPYPAVVSRRFRNPLPALC
jgi:hypothetical protein